MNDTLVVAVVTAVPSTIAAIAAFMSARSGKHLKGIASENNDLARENRKELAEVKHQTNGQLDEKIRKAVVSVFSDHKDDVTQAVIVESVRNLLDAMLTGTVEPYRSEEPPFPQGRHP